MSTKRFGTTTDTASTASTVKKDDGGKTMGIVLGVFLLVLILISLWGTCTESGISTFSNVKDKLKGIANGGKKEKLKDLDVIMFMSPTCPWCKKMLAVLEKEGEINNIKIVDTTTKEGTEMAQKYGADKQPIPSFISHKNHTGTVGYKETISDLVKALSLSAKNAHAHAHAHEHEHVHEMPTGPVDGALVKNLQVILFAREGCGWCTKAKENCAEAGVLDLIQVVDIMSPEGKEMADQLLPEGTSGVPSWVSFATKKHVVGFKPIDKIIQDLQ